MQLFELATDTAQSRFRPGDERLRERVIERLASLRGLPRKVGQVFSLGDPAAGDSDYQTLTEGEPILSADQVRHAVRDAIGVEPDAVFSWFDPHGVSASLGQVHRARLLDGRFVAVKVKYPDIERTLGLDLKALDWLTLPFGGLSRFDAAAFRAEIGGMLRRELDYRAEAESLMTFHGLSSQVRGLLTPECEPSLCGPDLLVMTWIEGGPVAGTKDWSRAERVAVGETLVDTFVRSLVQWRRVHADLHPGNLRFQRGAAGPTLGLVDFGCVKEITADAADSLGALFAAGLDDDWERSPAEYVSRFAAMGFKRDLLLPMADRLKAVARLLFEPFVSRTPVDLTSYDLSARMADALGPHRFNFRAAGPAEAFFVIRAWHGLLAHMTALDAPFVWRDRVQDAIGPRTLLQAVTGEAPAENIECRSRSLKIRVTEAGRTRVELTFPAQRAVALEELVPDDLGPRLVEQGIDIAALVRNAAVHHFEPGDLFRLHDGDKLIAVWLE